MHSMFRHSRYFNDDIWNWDMPRITDIDHAILESANFDGDISTWDVSSVTDMAYMSDATGFNGDISKWDVSRVIYERYVLFGGDISKWGMSTFKHMIHMCVSWSIVSFKGDVSSSDVSRVTGMDILFARARYNDDVSK